MCNFLSGTIDIKAPHAIHCGDLLRHEKTVAAFKLKPETYREWQWTADDDGASLVVRAAPGEDASLFKTEILCRYKTRAEILMECIRQAAKVGGSLYLGGCTGLKALPENLKVGGYLGLGGCTGLKALPEGLKSKAINWNPVA